MEPAATTYPAATRHRVLLVGWDALDSPLIDAPVEAGLLPGLQRLVLTGAMGDLAAIGPPVGPLGWTSIATGMRPDRHGILAEVEPDPGSGGWQPVSSRSRTAKALWNIATQAGLRSIVVGWAASQPAEPISGVCVDERFPLITGPREAAWPVADGSVMPASLGHELAPLRLHPSELRREDLLAFVPGILAIDTRRDPRPLYLAEAVARTVSIHAVATALLAREDWQFAAIRYPLLGQLAPTFLRCRPPGGEAVPAADIECYGQVMDAACRLQDGMLARLGELAGPDTTVILVSEGGLAPGPGTGTGTRRRPVGLVAIAGPGTRPDALLHGASHLDIAPTVLALLGLPVGADMPGRVLAEAFVTPPAVTRIDSWESLPGECGRLPPAPDPEPWQEHPAIRQLVAMGYAPPDDAAVRDVAIAATADLNLAGVHLEALEWQPAIAALRRVIAARPDDHPARLLLAGALILAGETAECRALADTAGTDPGLAPFAEAIRGLLATAEGRDDDALAHYLACEQAAPPSAFLFDRLGWAYLRLGRLDDAERVLEQSRAVDPDGRFVPFALAGIHLARNRPGAAAEEALRAIGRQYRWPAAHARLGVALARLGMPAEAARAFETSIAQQPSAQAHEGLAHLYTHALPDSERVAFHRDRARALRAAGTP